MSGNPVKAALAAGRVQIGTWIHAVSDPAVARILAPAGFDFVYVDMEHTAFSLATVEQICRSAAAAGMVPVVRPASADPAVVARPLDVGAMGLLVPHVDSGERAAAVVRAVRFPPAGERGMNWGDPYERRGATDVAGADRDVLVVVQIESDEGVAALDDILSVDGIDAAVVGRGDLAASLGIPGGIDDEAVVTRVRRTVAACRRHGRAAGLWVHDVASARRWVAEGVTLLPYASEQRLLRAAACAAVAELAPLRAGLAEVGTDG
jgi:2-keto-3-deoxy-L-rhamnonate aldolase RhmA